MGISWNSNGVIKMIKLNMTLINRTSLPIWGSKAQLFARVVFPCMVLLLVVGGCGNNFLLDSHESVVEKTGCDYIHENQPRPGFIYYNIVTGNVYNGTNEENYKECINDQVKQ